MRNGLYYLVALLLLLATVPMYRYVIEHSSREAVNQVRSPAGPPPITVEDLQRGFGPYLYYYRLGVDQLPEGYTCTQGGGYVYRSAEVGGVTTIEPLVRDGINVQCGY